jgi:hypothetical protein
VQRTEVDARQPVVRCVAVVPRTRRAFGCRGNTLSSAVVIRGLFVIELVIEFLIELVIERGVVRWRLVGLASPASSEHFVSSSARRCATV